MFKASLHLPRFLLWSALAAHAATLCAEPARTFAVRVPAESTEITKAVEQGNFAKWIAPRIEGLVLAVGPEAAGDLELYLETLPASEELRGRIAGLPVELHADAFVIDGERYDDPDMALALQLPGTERPTFVVIGRRPGPAAVLADALLAREAGVHFHRLPEEADYLVWEHRYSRRHGRWQLRDGRTAAADDRDDMAKRQAIYAALAPIERRHVVLRVPAERAAETSMTRLADTLDAAARSMAPKVPVPLTAPIEVIVESDYVAQALHLGRIDRSMARADGRLHLVAYEVDSFDYRQDLARLLLRRAGIELPPWLEDGAALWLSRDWFGRPYPAWLPDFAWGRVFPTAEELLREERQRVSSNVLWPPVAAAVVERLPGPTLRAKLADAVSPVRLTKLLRDIESEAGRAATAAVLPAAPRSGAAAKRPGFHRGVSLALAPGRPAGGYHAPGLDRKLTYLRERGVDSLAIMPLAMQRSADSSQFSYNYLGEPPQENDTGLIHAVRRAHVLGFRVLYKPQIYVGGSWPGEISMSSQEDWRTWWRTYRSYVLHHAVLAQWTGADMFAVGVELGKTIGFEEDWRHLIAAVR